MRRRGVARLEAEEVTGREELEPATAVAAAVAAVVAAALMI